MTVVSRAITNWPAANVSRTIPAAPAAFSALFDIARHASGPRPEPHHLHWMTNRQGMRPRGRTVSDARHSRRPPLDLPQRPPRGLDRRPAARAEDRPPPPGAARA